MEIIEHALRASPNRSPERYPQLVLEQIREDSLRIQVKVYTEAGSLTRWLCFLLAAVCLLTTALSSSAQQPGRQAGLGAVPGEPGAVLTRAKEVMGFARSGQSVIHYRAVAAAEQSFQSDRTYPPFFSTMLIREGWFDPQSAVERVSVQTTFPGNGPFPAAVMFTDAKRAFGLAKEKLNALPRTSMQLRYLNPWTVIADWSAAGDVRFAGREVYRDYPRVVLVRTLPDGEQRLFIDPKSGFPLKLDLIEKNYLWGQRHIEYLYTNWTLRGGMMWPGSSFRLADGKTEISQTTGDVEMIPPDASPLLSLPKEPAQSADALPLFLQPLDLTVVQVGPKTYLLSNPGYTEAVTEIGNEIFLFDPTQGEGRAKKDAEAIARLFPGQHKLTVVVTDLAWPHVAGVRYWVATGTTIIAHKAAQQFLQDVIDRRWTLAPDLLEQRRKTAKLKFFWVDTVYTMAGGAISLHPIDGIGSEVALMAYLVADRFLWASDYIQTVARPSSYASEVWSAVQRDGLRPERTAAEHLPLTPWSKIEELQKQLGTTSPSP